jgi:hypothetical protein|tara:strand:- start:6447 stop:6842 length:396 start_codon:yes stop_codon:yes gene_type:complete
MSNVKQVNIIRQVFDREAFNNTVPTEFTQLVNTPDPSFFDINLATQEDFWILYNKFFYAIPKFTSESSSNPNLENSHQYLAETSGGFIGLDPNRDEINALLEEIADLRTENLEVRQEIVEIIANFNDNQGT